MNDTQAASTLSPPRAERVQPRPVPRARRSHWAPMSRTASYWVLVIATISLGWLLRDRGWINAESGLGYWLGVTGGVLMLVLLLYPLRKRLSHLRWMGPTRYWFKLHMLFGVLGPLLVLFHCNFQLGSPNATIALVCMILVSISGVVGRHFYSKIHHGLYGRKATLKELQADLAGARNSQQDSIVFIPLVAQRLDKANQELLVPVSGLLASARRALVWTIRSRWMYWSLSRDISLQLRDEAANSPAIAAHRSRLQRAAQRYLRENLRHSRKVAEFTVYERLFALWHVFHLPLFLLMVLTALAHVLAVHMY